MLELFKGGAQNTGGITGRINQATILNCYNKGMIKGTKDVGGISAANQRGTIKNCYNIGKVTANLYIGSLLGYINISGTISNSYYLAGTANYALGGTTASNGSNPSGTAKYTEAQLISAIDLLNALQEPAVWVTDDNDINDGYPILSWQK